ncbi:uncharacterized protein FIBRA_04990 [Fibroporia radiculosa]|uniref:L-serine ammonia-lyase n=1 Tax=Fibroporia radiculosa TaxID=599839 RepID=J4IAG6_9APHY|nr:uncharacterized protein FIBRA_04990 [Fibroporia radiculosa]CCM02876.1 predicted protein [Fibroporia radiculosa]
MSVIVAGADTLWRETPLLFSPHISSRLGCNIYLKLENLHPSHSFKFRGISHFIQHAIRTHGRGVRLVIASGGNAGLAAACAANTLSVRCKVFLPEGASSSVLEFFEKECAEVVIEGKCYLQALKKAEEMVKTDPNAVMVPAYDDPLLWEGHGSMISEIVHQLPKGTKPDAIFCSVGGGGLAGGVMHGCKSVGWDDVPLITLETHGSNCFHQSLALNSTMPPATDMIPNEAEIKHIASHGVKVAHLPVLTSRASSLGASSPAPGVVRMALDREGGIRSVCVSDEFAMLLMIEYSNYGWAPTIRKEEHKMMVELACSTTLTPAYSPALFNKLVSRTATGEPKSVVFIVCGGFKISLKEIEEYRDIAERQLKSEGAWDVVCDGEWWSIEYK